MKQRIFGLACLALVASVTGCASPARVIKSDPMSVVVAVPDQTNDWPFHYRDEAFKTASTYIKDPVLVSTNRVKVGESVVNTQNTDRRDLKTDPNKPKFGEITTATNTTSIRDDYEYHLEFQSRSGGNQSPPPMPNGQIQQTGATQSPPPSASTTAPAPRRDNIDPRIPPAVNPPGYTPPSGFPTTGLNSR